MRRVRAEHELTISSWRYGPAHSFFNVQGIVLNGDPKSIDIYSEPDTEQKGHGVCTLYQAEDHQKLAEANQVTQESAAAIVNPELTAIYKRQ